MGAHTILMKVGTLVNRAISVPGPCKAGYGQGRVAGDEVVGKGLNRDREGHEKIRIEPGQGRIRTGQNLPTYLPTRGKGHTRRVGQPMSSHTRLTEVGKKGDSR